MRIVHTINNGFHAGGAEKSVHLVAMEQARRGHEVRIVATDLLTPDPGQRAFADVLMPALRGTPRRLVGAFWNRQMYLRMRELMRDFEPDVVNHHTLGEFGPSIISACRGRAQLVTAHGPEEWTGGLLRWSLASASDPRGLSAADRLRLLRLRRIQRPAYLRQFRHVDGFIAVSEFMARTIAPDVRAKPVRAVPNAAEPGFEPRPMTDADQVLFCGRLEPVKGVEQLIAAFRKVLAERPTARLAFAGEGSQRAHLERETADLIEAGSVRFLGWLQREALAAQISQSSLVVVPSLWPEVFGRVVLDAFEAARPVVASRIGGLPELVDETRGRLVAPGDVEELAAALTELLGDLPRLAAMGEAASAFACRYTIERIVDELDEEYARAVAARRG